MAHALDTTRPGEASSGAPSFGPPSIPYVPPPSLEEVARLARLRFRRRGRKGGRLILVGGIVYFLALPITLIWVKGVIEGILGSTVPLEDLLEEVAGNGYMPLLSGLLVGESLLATGAIVGAYLILVDRPAASFAMIVLGAIGIAVSVGYLGWLYGLVGLVGGILVAVGGALAIPRPLPGERLSAYIAVGRSR